MVSPGMPKLTYCRAGLRLLARHVGEPFPLHLAVPPRGAVPADHAGPYLGGWPCYPACVPQRGDVGFVHPNQDAFAGPDVPDSIRTGSFAGRSTFLCRSFSSGQAPSHQPVAWRSAVTQASFLPGHRSRGLPVPRLSRHMPAVIAAKGEPPITSIRRGPRAGAISACRPGLPEFAIRREPWRRGDGRPRSPRERR